MIQFVCQFPRQSEPAEETAQRTFFRDQIPGVHDPQHQFSLRFYQPRNELPAAIFHFLAEMFGLMYHKAKVCLYIERQMKRWQSQSTMKCTECFWTVWPTCNHTESQARSSAVCGDSLQVTQTKLEERCELERLLPMNTNYLGTPWRLQAVQEVE